MLGRAKEITRDWDPAVVQDRRPRSVQAGLQVQRVGSARRAHPHRDRSSRLPEQPGRRRTPRYRREAADVHGRSCARIWTSCSTDIQANLFQTAKKRLDDNTHTIDSYEEYAARVADGGFFNVHWCGASACEKRIQEETRSTIRNIPFDAPEEAGVCMVCGAPSTRRVIAAQAY